MTLRRLVAGWVLLLAACGGDAEDRPSGYSAELRAEFVVACVAQGTPQDQCGCFYDELETKVPFARYEEIDAAIRSGETDVPADIADLAASCAAAPDG
jgi:hypothetical protein